MYTKINFSLFFGKIFKFFLFFFLIKYGKFSFDATLIVENNTLKRKTSHAYYRITELDNSRDYQSKICVSLELK